jgi:hypothetical protein
MSSCILETVRAEVDFCANRGAGCLKICEPDTRGERTLKFSGKGISESIYPGCRGH